MITADKLALLTNLPTVMLRHALGKKAAEYNITASKFLGLTNGGQFCYTVVFAVKDGTDSTKVFVTYDSAEDQVSAEID